MDRESIGRLRRVFAVWLLCLATWSIVIKYLDPVLWSLAERWSGRAAPPPPILWDFWPVAHVVLALLLFAPRRGAWSFAVAVSAAEIAVVSVKFVSFLADPVWSFQRLSWFTNKIFVLATFLALLPLLLRGDVRRELSEAVGARRGRAARGGE